MPLPTLTKSWQLDVNQVLPTQAGGADDEGRAFWLAVKDSLVAFGAAPWAVHFSCDGTTAGTDGDGVDRWINLAAVMTTASDVGARSWLVLRQEATGMELLIDMRVSSTSTNRAPTVLVSWASGFTGGTTMSRPAAADEQDLSNNHSTTFSVGLGSPSSSTSRAYRLHVLHATDGTATMVVVCHASSATGFWYFGRPSNPTPGWANALVAGLNGGDDDAATDEGTQSKTLVLGDDTSFPRWHGNFPTNGSAPWLIVGLAVGDFSTLTRRYGTDDTPTMNEISNEWELWPSLLRCRTAGDRGIHGALPDVYLAADSSTLGTGDALPAAGTHLRAVFGALVIPWDGSIPQTA